MTNQRERELELLAARYDRTAKTGIILISVVTLVIVAAMVVSAVIS